MTLFQAPELMPVRQSRRLLTGEEGLAMPVLRAWQDSWEGGGGCALVDPTGSSIQHKTTKWEGSGMGRAQSHRAEESIANSTAASR